MPMRKETSSLTIYLAIGPNQWTMEQSKWSYASVFFQLISRRLGSRVPRQQNYDPKFNIAIKRASDGRMNE